MRKSVSFYKPLTFYGLSDIIAIEFKSERQNAVYRILIVEDDEGIAQRLHLQSQDSEFARRTPEDLMRIERYVEMVMGYLRLDSDFTDYVIREYDLDGIVKQAVQKRTACRTMIHQKEACRNISQRRMWGRTRFFVYGIPGLGLHMRIYRVFLKRDIQDTTEDVIKKQAGSDCIYAAESAAI